MSLTVPILVFAVLLGATGLMRLAEMFVSIRRMRARPEAVIPEPGLFPAMAALHAGLVVLPLAEVVLLGRPFVIWLGAAALVTLGLATALRVWTLATIGRAWNVRVVAPSGDQIATTGPYAWIRHPNYLVVVLEIAALPLLHGAWIAAVGLTIANGLVLARRIRNEEAVLTQIPAWREAMRNRKRLVPGIL